MPDDTWESIPYDDLPPEERAPCRPPVYPPAIIEHVAKWVERFAERAAVGGVNLSFTALAPFWGRPRIGPHIPG